MLDDKLENLQLDLSATPAAQTTPTALRSGLTGPWAPSASTGEDRLVIGGIGAADIGTDGGTVDGRAINGVTATGPQAHAAVRMHVTPAPAPWAFDQGGATYRKFNRCPATASSTGRLRTS